MSTGEFIPERIRLRIIFHDELLVDTHVNGVLIPGLDGELGILPGHRSMVLAMGDGRITFQQEGQEENVSVSGGYAEIQPDSVLIFSWHREEDKTEDIP